MSRRDHLRRFGRMLLHLSYGIVNGESRQPRFFDRCMKLAGYSRAERRRVMFNRR